ncbi:MAG: cyclic nucleotide-binding domain-containing protein [Myxococcales bacterium]|nr:cyclic nucleotide-binding domain-containing protein [Myxococcales bacterium]
MTTLLTPSLVDLWRDALRALPPAERRRLLEESLAADDAGRGDAAGGDAEPARPGLRIIPFEAGRRPLDELRCPGSGCSEHVDYLDSRADADADDNPDGGQELWLLFDLEVPAEIDGLEVEMRATLLDPCGADDRPLTGACGPLALQRLTQGPRGPVLEPLVVAPGRLRAVAVVPRAALLAAARAGAFELRAHFHRRLRIELGLRRGDLLLAGDQAEVEIYDLGRIGELYERVLERLLPADLAAQASALGRDDLRVEHHPWYPVLAIGMAKARAYLDAIRRDLDVHTTHLADPRWLLRVGLYLELLTGLGIAMAVRDQHPDLLSADEWAAVDHAPCFAAIRRHLDVDAWRGVWAERHIAPARTGLWAAGPVGLGNLRRKERAIGAFLEAHHEDLKAAMLLAGANQRDAQETWHRVFRDAERAVLGRAGEAFPELGALPEATAEELRWHRCGQLPFLGGARVPARLSALFGDQDGLFPAACRLYRASMNHVAEWARARGLIDFTGDECVPPSASLLEALMVGDRRRWEELQRADGHGDAGPPVIPALAEVSEALAAAPELALLGDAERRWLAAAARRIDAIHHQRLVRQGEVGESIFVVASGQVEVVRRGADGRDRRLGVLRSGALFGELAALGDGKRGATVRALEGAVVYEIGQGALLAVLHAQPRLALALGAMIARRGAALPGVAA